MKVTVFNVFNYGTGYEKSLQLAKALYLPTIVMRSKTLRTMSSQVSPSIIILVVAEVNT